MRALIVVESVYSNTERIGRILAEELQGQGVELVWQTAGEPLASGPFDLVLVGAPTHNRGLPSPASRATARSKGARVPDVGVREWIAGVDPGRLKGVRVIAFDTVAGKSFLMGSAAKAAVKALSRRAIPAEFGASFVVKGTVLAPGQEERARKWANELV